MPGSTVQRCPPAVALDALGVLSHLVFGCSLSFPAAPRLLISAFIRRIGRQHRVYTGTLKLTHPSARTIDTMTTAAHRNLRIGVDVGGTNTDGVLLDSERTSELDRGIVAWHKTPTTANPNEGIENVISTLFEKAQIDASSVASVTIGTTHFINAVLEKDRSRLAPIAVLRLCGPFTHDVEPGLDWPEDLRRLICRYCAFLKGGIEVDGHLISQLDEEEIAREALAIKSMGIKAIVINSVFSPADVEEQQEEKARDIVLRHYPEADIVISKEVANLGFLERENAAMLNASILTFARKTINAFRHATTGRLKLTCPIFLTQNDGTILPAHNAARLPIRTFASGPTNSMCGARFLAQSDYKEALLVVDIGGTSTDVGMLLPSGFPRQAAAVTELAGIRMNFSFPDVKSIALGGGSVVRKSDEGLTIGPDSVGYQIQEKALVFGGDIPTTTDYAVAQSEDSHIGDRARVKDIGDFDEFNAAIKQKLEGIIDRMKTSADDISVLLVGGGAAITPDKLNGASHVIKPEYAGVANAIGAAIARVSGIVDTVVSTTGKTMAAVMAETSQVAVERAVSNGAKKDTVTVVEQDAFPLPYIANKSRIIVKAVGDYDFTANSSYDTEIPEEDEDDAPYSKDPTPVTPSVSPPIDLDTYKPKVVGREWFISELDLEWISCGCYILGTGGGGTPYPHFIRLRDMLRKGAVVRVIDPSDLSDSAAVACGGYMGSPTVSMEKLSGGEMMEAQTALYDYLKTKPDAVLSLEIGGGNGLQGLILGASTNMDIPVLDGDWMGRAYPTAHQITPVIYESGALFLPTVMADGNGNQLLFLRATSEEMIERALRAALSEMGAHVALARGPYPGAKTKRYIVENTMSLAWRIGRAVGGAESAKVLFKGKIVGVERRLVKGHSYGEVVIEAMDVNGTGHVKHQGKMKIPFKNENIYCFVENEDGKEEVIAAVPDLICVIDAQNGEALGTPEYRYGLFVLVIGITGSPRWTSTPAGIALGGPRAFDMDIDYKPLGVFAKPRSVIEEFA
ncbi:hypothetical protein EVG20_g7127 [Dentipellis fragilis]|uniref:Hydantoinase/oxoprolinase N-terminal domain-containing protein n=1 Tax=Dentipellis fragilis TaxID=205917 RepID=A0A4Y9YHR3_9AGAM|nr:hypothetical protein EVG20_g7127 [Dentipellis fragilis]